MTDKVFVLFECDHNHRHASRKLIGVFTGLPFLIDAVKKHSRDYGNDFDEEAKEQLINMGQTQKCSMNEYIVDVVTLNENQF